MSSRGVRSSTQGPTAELLVCPSPGSRQSTRFRRFQLWILGPGQASLPLSRLLVGSMIGFDGGWTRQGLLSALDRCHSWLDLQGEVSVSWSQEGVHHRRILSHFSSTCWRSLTRLPKDWGSELIDLAIAYQPFESKADGRAIVEDLLQDGRRWSELVLPPLLSAHVAGLVQLKALPDAAWRRRISMGGELPPAAPSLQRNHSTHDDLLWNRVGSGRTSCGDWFFQRLKFAVNAESGSSSNVSNARARNALSARLNELSNELEHTGLAGSLLMGWVQDLLVFGSARREKPAINTIRNYFHAAADLLLKSMNSGEDVIDWEASEWMAIYQSAIDGSNESQRRILGPALVSWHRFLMRTLDVGPVQSVYVSCPEQDPDDASIIWPHEIERAKRLLESMSMEERERAQCLAVLELLTQAGLRRSEIITLRLESLWFGEEGVVIDVSPRRSQKQLKSEAARRQVWVKSASARDTLDRWVRRRVTEASTKVDLLFEDPHRPGQIFRFGQTYERILQALKQATGDPTVSWHTCRHAYASHALVDALIEPQHKPVSGLYKLQRAMGHANLTTTLKTYCHVYEPVLRACLDSAIADFVTSRHLSDWTGQTAATLRQRKRRLGIKGRAILDRAFEHVALAPTRSLSNKPAAIAPSARTNDLTYESLTFDRFVRVVRDVARGLSADGVGSANSIGPETINRVSRAIYDSVDGSDPAYQPTITEARNLIARIDFSRLDRACWQRSIEVLNIASPARRDEIAKSWRECGKECGISVCDPDRAGPVLQLLGEAEFGAARVRLRIARLSARASTRTEIESDDYIHLAVSELLGEHVHVEHVMPRRGRSSAYVVPLTACTDSVPAPSARVDMKSLGALMFLCCAFGKTEFCDE